MQLIPKIIHQIWSDKHSPLPEICSALAETWKERHPDWEYIYWDEKKMDSFLSKEYPQLCDFYYSLPYDMQRWDAIRFLILNKMGGLHVDFDYECLENIERLLENKTCCIALEPETHCRQYKVPYILNSAFIGCVAGAPFLKKVIDKIFSEETMQYDRINIPMYILNTTGPQMLSKLYSSLSEEEKKNVYLIPAKYVTPVDITQAGQLKAGLENEELENCLQEAYAVHYFTCSWIPLLRHKR